MAVIVRKAVKEDIPHIFKLIQELALFEKAPEEVSNTEARMLEDGFGENPIYTAAVAELDGKIVGMYVWYVRYSTWKGKGLYLEDIIVTEAARGKGVGKLLFEACMADAKAINAHFMKWQVLDWNTPAIEFYKKYNAQIDAGWYNASLSREQIHGNPMNQF